MNCMVIGYGSIGQRHIHVLEKLGFRVAVVSKRVDIEYALKYDNLYDAMSRENPDYITIANKTCSHYQTFCELAVYGFKGIVLVEKPLFITDRDIPANNFKKAYVAYNLRFHPIIQKVYEIIKQEKTLFAQVYTGQYLPNWRPNSDYWLSYSAKRAEGGGVLLDLSHELDYISWLFGDWKVLTAIGGKYSTLSTDSDDFYSLMLVMEKCPAVQIHVNYLDRINRREITVITEKYSVKADLVQQTLKVNNDLTQYEIDRDYTYAMQHKAIIKGIDNNLCTLDDGRKVLKIIDCAVKASKQGVWVSNLFK